MGRSDSSVRHLAYHEEKTGGHICFHGSAYAVYAPSDGQYHKINGRTSMKKVLFFLAILLVVTFVSGCGFFFGGRDSLSSYNDASSERITAYIMSKNKKLSQATAQDMANTIISESRTHNFHPYLITALINKESSFNPNAVSSSNAKGLGQLKDATAKSVGVNDPFDYKQNIAGLCRYLKMMYNNFEEKPNAMDLALASYRMGPGYIKRTVVANNSPLPDVAVTYIEKIKAEASKI